MKASTVISQIRSILPYKSPYFTSSLTVTGITKAGLVATVTTSAAHGLAVGEIVTINGVLTPTEIDTITDGGTYWRIKTVTPHDQTLHPSDGDKYITVTGTAYSASFRIVDVANRYTLDLEKGAQPAFPVGTTYLQEGAIVGYNGLKAVASVPTTTTFTYTINFDLPAPNYTTGAKVYAKHRISGAVNIEVMLNSYTKQPLDALWAFVVMGDTDANKDRKNLNDAITTQGRQSDFTQKMIDSFSVFIVVPNKGDVLTKTNGLAARDIIEDIRLPLMQSLLGIRFPASLTAQGQGIVTYAGDSFYEYNSAYYVHEFRFQQVVELTLGDTAIAEFDRAFRDVDLTIQNQFSDVTEYTALVNLDDQPEA